MRHQRARIAEAIVVLFCCGLLLTAAAEAADDESRAQDLFRKMTEATRQLNYDGVFIYQRGHHTDSMRIVHRASAGGEQERLISLSGAPREVIRNNGTVTCIFPETHSVTIDRNHPRQLFPALIQPMTELNKYYRFVMLGHDRVAGRATSIVGIQPRTAFRYGYRLWIDDEDNLLLRSDVVNSRGTALEQILFTQIRQPATIPDALLEPGIDSSNFTRHDQGGEDETLGTAAGEAGNGRWKVQWVPEGFALREYQVQKMASSKEPVQHIVYSDGLAMVSVFVEKLGADDPPMKGFSAMGAVNAYSTIADHFQITAVGEVPPLTVRQIATSVIPVADAK